MKTYAYNCMNAKSSEEKYLTTAIGRLTARHVIVETLYGHMLYYLYNNRETIARREDLMV